MSFFLVFVAQHLMLAGITLPLLAVNFYSAEWNYVDSLAAVTCVLGE